MVVKKCTRKISRTIIVLLLTLYDTTIISGYTTDICECVYVYVFVCEECIKLTSISIYDTTFAIPILHILLYLTGTLVT